ncbi:MAG: hypothetical protein L7F78_15730 [Syntrophales bacterium LBB04]|nr:hypothetical protein [Syntrophales bacterium LBB04]
MAFTDFSTIRVSGVPLWPEGVDVSGVQYFVAGNYGSDDNNGSSWDEAFATVAKAIAVSNANIAASSRGWAARNTIFISGDYFAENLVAFPNKCDVIGVGSYDANAMPGIYGNHAPVNAGNYGTRFINVRFQGPAVASPLVTLASTSSGIQFIRCWFHAAAQTTTAITSTASPFLQVINCEFDGAFATAYISIAAGEAGATRILRNRMVDAAAVGILVTSATTSWKAIIAENFIHAGTITIDENTDLFYIYNNILISDAVCATVGTMANGAQCDINVFRAANNWLTCSNVANVAVPPVHVTT